MINIFDTGDIADAVVLDPPKTITRHRASFTDPFGSGEQPLVGLLPRAIERFTVGPVVATKPQARPDATARIVITTPDAEPEESRPLWYRGQRRWTRSRALLVAATWPGGVR